MALTRLKTAALLAGLAGAIALPGVAQAQFYFDSWGGRFDAPLPRDDFDGPYRSYERPYREPRSYREMAPNGALMSRGEIASILSRRGYRVSQSIGRNGDVYLVDAVDPTGRSLRLVVDAYDGSVIQRTATGGAIGREPPPRALSRREDPDTYFDDDFGAPPPPRGAEPRVIPGVGPAQRKPAPKAEKPATARVEPRAPAPKPATTPPPATTPAPAVQAAPVTPPAPVASTKTAAPQARAEAPAARATTEPSPTTAPRVIPLYKTPSESEGGKPADGAP